MTALPTLGFLGGTGKLGRGLGLRLAAAGHPILIGSRSEPRAIEAVERLRTRLATAGHTDAHLDGMRNCDVLPRADVVFLTVPFETLDSLLDECGTLLAGKIVVDVVNPLRLAGERFELFPVPEGSAGARTQRLVPGARVVSAFKNAAAGHLLRLEVPAEGDILVAADDAGAKTSVATLVAAIPNLRAVDAGPLANAGLLEAVTALELNLNRRHKALTSIRILGLEGRLA